MCVHSTVQSIALQYRKRSLDPYFWMKETGEADKKPFENEQPTDLA